MTAEALFTSQEAKVELINTNNLPVPSSPEEINYTPEDLPDPLKDHVTLNHTSHRLVNYPFHINLKVVSAL